MALSKRRRTASTRPAATSSTEDTELDAAAPAEVEGSVAEAEGRSAREEIREDEAEASRGFDGFDQEIAPPPARSDAAPVRRSTAKDPARRRAASDRRDARTASADAPARTRSTARTAVPEAAKDSAATQSARARRAAEAERTSTSRRRVAAVAPNPAWLAPTAVTLLILGLVYLVTYYLSSARLPLPIGDWNLLVGFGIMIAGGGLLMRWK